MIIFIQYSVDIPEFYLDFEFKKVTHLFTEIPFGHGEFSIQGAVPVNQDLLVFFPPYLHFFFGH